MTDTVALPSPGLFSEMFRFALPHSDSLAIQIDVYTDPSTLSDDWRALETVGLGTLFQSYAWTSAWCRHAASHFSEEPIIVAGRDAQGLIAFILPFAAKAMLGQKLLTWLGQDHAGYGFGLYRRDFLDRLDQPTMQIILEKVLAVHPDIAGLHLTNQPNCWDGIRNPFLQMPSQPISLEVTAFALSPDFDGLYRSSLTGKMRRNMRRRLEKLQEIDVVDFSLPSDGEQRIDAFSVFQTQKASQLRQAQEPNPFDIPAIQDFYRDFLSSSEDSCQHLTGVLRVGDTKVAVELCVGFHDRVYALNRSMTDSDFRQYSPGWQLNTWLVQRSCSDGYKVYDLGPGSAEYKEDWNSYKIQCFSTIVPFSFSAVLHTGFLKLLARSKYAVSCYLKDNPAMRLRITVWYNKLRTLSDRVRRTGV